MNVNTSVNVQNGVLKLSKIQFSGHIFHERSTHGKKTSSILCKWLWNVSDTVYPRGIGYDRENVNMSAWRAILMACFIVLLLPFSSVLTMKVNIGGTSHICVSGSQVFHVNFGDGPVQQCGVMNTTPTSNKDKPSCAAEKAKEQAKGLFVSLRESVSFHE